jgi:hypothetical protein
MARRRNIGIYDPPHPSVRPLPDEARADYDEAYAEAKQAYGDDETAAATAWRTVRLKWKQRSRRQWDRCHGRDCGWPPAMVLPEPHELVGLGVLVEYGFVDRQGELQIRNFRGEEPTLWWDESRQALYAFPRMKYVSCRLDVSVSKQTLETYERWHQRESQCFDEIEVPAVQVKCVGASDTISYRSDKWHDRNPDPRVRGAQEYIHHNWKEVWTFQDVDSPRTRPNAIFIQGGELALHERGLIH